MPKEPYITPEITSEELVPGTLANSGTPSGAVQYMDVAPELGICCTGCG